MQMEQTDKDIKTIKIITIISIIVGLLLLIITIVQFNRSYAFFSSYVDEINPGGEIASIDTENVSIDYDSGNSIIITDVKPGWTTSKQFSITNNADIVQTYNIVWRNVENTFVNNADLVYEITGENRVNETIAPLSDGGIISTISINPNETHGYELYLTYNGLNFGLDKGAIFNGDIKIEVGSASVVREDLIPNQAIIEEVINDILIAANETKVPVGNVITTLSATNPEEYLGFGTWEQISKGKTLVGVDENDTDFNIVEKTGGNKNIQAHTHTGPSHTHTVPAHTHNVSASNSVTSSSTGAHGHNPSIGIYPSGTEAGGYGVVYSSSAGFGERVIVQTTAQYVGVNSAGAHTHTLSATTSSTARTTGASGTANTTSTGSGDAQNLQPYYTAYIWKRVA